MLVDLLGGVRATVFAGLAAVLLLALGVQTWRLDRSERQQELDRIAWADAVSKVKDEIIALEREHAEKYAAIAGRLVTENENAKAEVDRLLAGLRDGTERLRRRFQCPSGAVPGAPAAAGGSDGAGEGGLRDEDAGFFIREAERADAIARRLTACQNLLQQQRNSAQPAGGAQ